MPVKSSIVATSPVSSASSDSPLIQNKNSSNYSNSTENWLMGGIIGLNLIPLIIFLGFIGLMIYLIYHFYVYFKGKNEEGEEAQKSILEEEKRMKERIDNILQDHKSDTVWRNQQIDYFNTRFNKNIGRLP